jgi:hypothetical protein
VLLGSLENAQAASYMEAAEEILTKTSVKNVDEFIVQLPDSLKKDFTFVIQSQSPEKKTVVPEFPRVILFDNQHQSALAYTTFPYAAQDFSKIQMIQANPKKKRNDFAEIVFVQKSRYVIRKNPPECFSCHVDGQFRYEDYSSWKSNLPSPHIEKASIPYGANDDFIGQGSFLWSDFLKFKALGLPRVQALNLHPAGMKDSRFYPYDQIGKTEGVRASRPNLKLTRMVSENFAFLINEKIKRQKPHLKVFSQYLGTNCLNENNERIFLRALRKIDPDFYFKFEERVPKIKKYFSGLGILFNPVQSFSTRVAKFAFYEAIEGRPVSLSLNFPDTFFNTGNGFKVAISPSDLASILALSELDHQDPKFSENFYGYIELPPMIERKLESMDATQWKMILEFVRKEGVDYLPWIEFLPRYGKPVEDACRYFHDQFERISSEETPRVQVPMVYPANEHLAARRLFVQQCLKCHERQAPLMPFRERALREELRKNDFLARIVGSVNHGRMPLGNPLSPGDRQLLLNYFTSVASTEEERERSIFSGYPLQQLSQQEAEKILLEAPLGSFILRKSSQGPKFAAITFNYSTNDGKTRQVGNFRLRLARDAIFLYKEDEAILFNELNELLSLYQLKPLSSVSEE